MKIYRFVINFLSRGGETGTTTFVMAAKSADIAKAYARASLEFEGKEELEFATEEVLMSLSSLMGQLKRHPERAVEIERTDF